MMSRPVESCTRLASMLPKNSSTSPSPSMPRRCRLKLNRYCGRRTRPSNDIPRCRRARRYQELGADIETRWNVVGAHHADKHGVESAQFHASDRCPDGVAAFPACSGFVVPHGVEQVVVRSLGFRDCAGLLSGDFHGESRLAVGRNQLVGLNVAIHGCWNDARRGGFSRPAVRSRRASIPFA